MVEGVHGCRGPIVRIDLPLITQGLEHPQSLVSAEGPGTDFPQVPMDG